MRRSSQTSIFSSQYQKKQRRKSFFKKLAVFLLLAVALVIIFRKPILAKVEKVRQDILQEEKQKEELLENLPPTPVETPETAETPGEPVVEEKTVTLTLPGDVRLALSLEGEGEDLHFAPLTELVGYQADLSPSGKLLVLQKDDVQELYVADPAGTVTEITYRIYKSSRGYTETKESILGRLPGFVWSTQPRFLDEDTVVYLSQLPWFDNRRFLYVVELNPLSHKSFQSVKGVNVTLKGRTEKGLEYEADGKTRYLTPDMKIISP
ncbi:hypothetical protein KCG48_05520 [Proteiniclasticum sp. BAD-10]|uniref:Uncharacterized protein n=1 Tax=Proteiniclasticum sediminis TaxID=2804028 RepID=A0A941CPP8_9CLOT|nr:hypothetical protein [Proteiniclasticum sediminis]MBR0575799.1 hypothetical protein [Proteiniclasticum sediminis]